MRTLESVDQIALHVKYDWILSGGRLRLDGALPTNTDGGGLSGTHPGMRGLFLLCEATRQLRGDAGASQVAGAEIAVAHGSGGWLSTQGTVVLGTEEA